MMYIPNSGLLHSSFQTLTIRTQTQAETGRHTMIKLTTTANARVLIVGEGRLVDEIVRNLTAHGRHNP